MNFNIFFILYKKSIAILLFSLIEINVYVNCGPISSRGSNSPSSQPRSSKSANASSQSFDLRRRDGPVMYLGSSQSILSSNRNNRVSLSTVFIFCSLFKLKFIQRNRKSFSSLRPLRGERFCCLTWILREGPPVCPNQRTLSVNPLPIIQS